MSKPFPRQFWLLWFGALLNKAGDFVQPFLAIYLSRERGLNPAQVGWILSLWGVGGLACGPVGGLMADRLGRRRALILATLLSALGMLQLGFAREIHHLAIAACVVGFLGPLYRPALYAMVADLLEPEQRQRAYAFLYWAANLGFAFSTVVAGVMSQYGFTFLFVADAATTVGFGVVAWRFLPETRPPRLSASAPAERTHRELAAPFRDPLLVALLACVLLTALVFSQLWCTLPLEMGRHGISPATYGRVMAVNGLLIVAFQMAAVKLVKRVEPALAMALSSLLVGIGFGAFGLVGSAPGYAAAIVIWTLGEIGQMPVVSTLVSDLAPADRRGAYQGAHLLVFAVANCMAPLLGGYALQRAGATWLWGGCFGLGLAAAAGHLLLAPAERRRLGAIGLGATPAEHSAQ